MRKGDLVKLNESACFTKENGGDRTYPLTNWASDEAGVVDGFYKLTDADRAKMRELDCYKGMGEDGESKLVPSEGGSTLKRNQVYTLLRSRAQAVRNYRKVSGLALVRDTDNGIEVYVKREYLELA